MGCTNCNTPCNECTCANQCGCENITPSTCVQYTGDTLECLGIPAGEMLNKVLLILNEKLCNLNGINGLSAYEIAVGLGFVGTESEWIASLQGADASNTGFSAADNGDGTITFTFPDGTTYTTPDLSGNTGSSAYDIWLSLGNVGTEADFIASLQGGKGDTGDPATNTFKVLGSNFTRTESGDGSITLSFNDSEIDSEGDILEVQFNLTSAIASSGAFSLVVSAGGNSYPIISKTLDPDAANTYHVKTTLRQSGTGLSGSTVYLGLPETIMIDATNLALIPSGINYDFIFTVTGVAGDVAIDDIVIIRKKVE